MTKLTQQERLAVVESKLDTVIEQLKQVGSKLDTFATKAEVSELKRKHSLQVWLVGSLSAGFGVMLTILIQGFFKG